MKSVSNTQNTIYEEMKEIPRILSIFKTFQMNNYYCDYLCFQKLYLSCVQDMSLFICGSRALSFLLLLK